MLSHHMLSRHMLSHHVLSRHMLSHHVLSRHMLSHPKSAVQLRFGSIALFLTRKHTHTRTHSHAHAHILFPCLPRHSFPLHTTPFTRRRSDSEFAGVGPERTFMETRETTFLNSGGELVRGSVPINVDGIDASVLHTQQPQPTALRRYGKLAISSRVCPILLWARGHFAQPTAVLRRHGKLAISSRACPILLWAG
jgi:hypothetical protein